MGGFEMLQVLQKDLSRPRIAKSVHGRPFTTTP